MTNSKNLSKRSNSYTHLTWCRAHSRLFQVKPLTEEEKAQKLEELKEKMAAKRALKAVEEAKEAKANEAIRRKAGKVSSSNDIHYSFLTHCLGHEPNQG